MNFYEFNQNNTGGSFVVDDKLCHKIIIEANSEKEAIAKAEVLGCYWDGVSEGYDCPCCGDRWYDSPSIIELSEYQQKGYPAYQYSNIYSEKEWFKNYGKLKRKEEPKLRKNRSFGNFGTEIYFDSIEDYCQLMANMYGWTIPDIRIYYANGNVSEIFSEKLKEHS